MLGEPREIFGTEDPLSNNPARAGATYIALSRPCMAGPNGVPSTLGLARGPSTTLSHAQRGSDIN